MSDSAVESRGFGQMSTRTSVRTDATALNPFASGCLSRPVKQSTTKSRQMRRFAQVRLEEGGWLLSDDKLAKSIGVKVAVIQSRAARGVSFASASSWPASKHSYHPHRMCCTSPIHLAR